MSKQKTVTFEPAEDVRRMLDKALTKAGKPRGMTTALINHALRNHLIAQGFAPPWSGGKKILADGRKTTY